MIPYAVMCLSCSSIRIRWIDVIGPRPPIGISWHSLIVQDFGLSFYAVAICFRPCHGPIAQSSTTFFAILFCFVCVFFFIACWWWWFVVVLESSKTTQEKIKRTYLLLILFCCRKNWIEWWGGGDGGGCRKTGRGQSGNFPSGKFFADWFPYSFECVGVFRRNSIYRLHCQSRIFLVWIIGRKCRLQLQYIHNWTELQEFERSFTWVFYQYILIAYIQFKIHKLQAYKMLCITHIHTHGPFTAFP